MEFGFYRVHSVLPGCWSPVQNNVGLVYNLITALLGYSIYYNQVMPLACCNLVWFCRRWDLTTSVTGLRQKCCRTAFSARDCPAVGKVDGSVISHVSLQANQALLNADIVGHR